MNQTRLFKSMRRIAVLLCALCACLLTSAAVDITAEFTDENFRNAVRETLQKGAGDPIYDTDVAEIVELRVTGKKIASLAGLEYFTSLRWLFCYGNQLTALPELPATLVQLYCYGNQLTALPELPAGLTDLVCWNNQLTALPALPDGLTRLEINANPLTAFPALPPALELLNCGSLRLTSLPALPPTLVYLYCYDNQLTALPALPAGLKGLNCGDNFLTGIALNGDVTYESLDVRNNYLKSTADVTGFSGAWDTGNYFFTPQRTPDGAGSVVSSALKVFPGDGGLWLTGLVPGGRLTVYTMLGQPVFAGAVSAAELFLPLSARGAYVIYHAGYGLKAVY